MKFQGIEASAKILHPDGSIVDVSTAIHEDHHFVLQISESSPDVRPSLGKNVCRTDVAPLLQVKSHGFLSLQGPCVTEVDQAISLRAQTMLGTDRAIALTNQGFVWGDDEIVWHLVQIQQQWTSGKSLGDVMPQIIDPLLAHGWSRVDATASIHAWFQSHNTPSLVCTAVLHQKHWIPLVLQLRHGRLEVGYVKTGPADESCILHLVSMITAALQQTDFEIVPVELQVSSPSCGAYAIAFIRNMILGDTLPTSSSEIVTLHEQFRAEFVRAIGQTWVAYITPGCGGQALICKRRRSIC